jgi:hypothetical protein
MTGFAAYVLLNVRPGVPKKCFVTACTAPGEGARADRQNNTRPLTGAPMLATHDTAAAAAPAGIPAGMPLLAAADLQDHLLVASNDLDRLQRLLEDAGNALMGHFTDASGHLRSVGEVAAFQEALRSAQGSIAGAITALQFQDMASQLITHTSKRLRNCADRIARDSFGSDEEGESIVEEAPLRPNPVTQDEMDAGSVELF